MQFDTVARCCSKCILFLCVNIYIEDQVLVVPVVPVVVVRKASACVLSRSGTVSAIGHSAI
jgi:hypothetical protein